MKIKKKMITGAITLMILSLLFFAFQDVRESEPKANLLNDQLFDKIDSLENELTCYKERELMLLRHVTEEEYVITAYLPIDSAERRYSGLTAIGTAAKPCLTLAVDPEVIPINSWIWIDGLGWWKAQDTGDKIRGQKMDLCLSSREEAKEFGVRKMKVKILK